MWLLCHLWALVGNAAGKCWVGAGRVGTAPHSTQTRGCGSCEPAWRHRNSLITAAESNHAAKSSSGAGNWPLALGSGDLQGFYKKLLKSLCVPNAELISVCRATHCCQQILLGILKHTEILKYKMFGKISCDYFQEGGEKVRGSTQLSTRGLFPWNQRKNIGWCHTDQPPKSPDDRLGWENWADFNCTEKLGWQESLLPKTSKHNWRIEPKKRFLGNHHGLKIELFLSAGVPLLRTVWEQADHEFYSQLKDFCCFQFTLDHIVCNPSHNVEFLIFSWK